MKILQTEECERGPGNGGVQSAIPISGTNIIIYLNERIIMLKILG